jgi:hypothetical protein
VAAADQRQGRHEAGHPGEAVEEMVLGPEHDRRAEDDGAGNRLEHRLFAERLGAGVVGRRIQIGADRRDMGKAGDAGGARGFSDGAGAEDMDGIEALAAGFGEDRDQIDHRIGALDGAVDRPAIAEIGLDRMDPADAAARLEMAGEIGPAHGGADAPAALQERAHEMAAEEAGAAKDRHQTLVVDRSRHSRNLPGLPARATIHAFTRLISARRQAVQALPGRGGGRN